MLITTEDKRLLRHLAEIVAEIAAQPEQAEKRELWYAHNDLKPTRPLVHCDPENGWNEIIPPETLQCETPLGRYWEFTLRKEIFWGQKMKDDKVIEPYFDLGHAFSAIDWGIQEKVIRTDSHGAYTWEPPLKSYEDMSLLHHPQLTVCEEETRQRTALAEEIFDGLLEVRIRGYCWWSLGLTITATRFRGLQEFLMDFYDHPNELHSLMAFLRDGYLSILDYLEQDEFLTINNDSTYVGSGGFGYTRQLPAADYDGRVRTSDIWGFAESQETVGVSPGIFEEFVFQYQLPILERFGLNCYGCCEPLDSRWHIVKRIPRLRRVSVSPWADRVKMAENLQDKYIYSLKPNPALLAMPSLNESLVRKELQDSLSITKECRVEIIMKDNHTIGRNPDNVVRWVQIAREVIEDIYA